MILIGTTLTNFAMSRVDAWSSWLHNAEAQIASHPDGVRHFVAIEADRRGTTPFVPLMERLAELGGDWWTYSLDDGRTEVGMTNRWRHIVAGQNLVTDYAQSQPECSHLLFLAADTAAPPDIIPRMLEMEHPLCAPYITTYGLRGEPVPGYPAAWGVEDAMASAAAIFIGRDVFRSIRWRWDLDAGMSDDPCYHHDAKTLLGVPTHVRHDVHAMHYPRSVGAYETRFEPEALEVRR